MLFANTAYSLTSLQSGGRAPGREAASDMTIGHVALPLLELTATWQLGAGPRRMHLEESGGATAEADLP